MFIFCWLPFFTLYLMRPFCNDCINQTLFSVLFWLGYCNSAVNPLIYATFSKDFRFAFKRVIYRCFCSKKYLEENKFHVLHRFVPFPFAAAGIAGHRNELDLDISRWRSFSKPVLNANTSGPLTEMCHPLVITTRTTLSNNTPTYITESTATRKLFRSQSVRINNSMTRL